MLLTIQYLRAISILMVISSHSMGGFGLQGVEFGVQGVDIFFVISGFIMMHIMHQRSQNYLEFFFVLIDNRTNGFLETYLSILKIKVFF